MWHPRSTNSFYDAQPLYVASQNTIQHMIHTRTRRKIPNRKPLSDSPSSHTTLQPLRLLLPLYAKMYGLTTSMASHPTPLPAPYTPPQWPLAQATLPPPSRFDLLTNFQHVLKCACSLCSTTIYPQTEARRRFAGWCHSSYGPFPPVWEPQEGADLSYGFT